MESKSKSILIVDDSDDFRDIIATKLRSLGFEVTEAKDGKNGVLKAKEIKPDVILLDVSMPILDGVGALLEIKKIAELKDVRCAFLTGYGDDHHPKSDHKVAGELGADLYIRKTDDLSEIVKKVNELFTS